MLYVVFENTVPKCSNTERFWFVLMADEPTLPENGNWTKYGDREASKTS